jgi:hypothetical protein
MTKLLCHSVGAVLEVRNLDAIAANGQKPMAE